MSAWLSRSAERISARRAKLVAQPARVRLRLELGDPLFVRNGRGMVPTPRALELAPTLSRALREFDRAVRDEAFNPATTTRQFTLAMADAGQISQLPTLCRLVSAQMPHATIRAVGINTYLSWGGAPSADIDAAITAIEDAAPGVHMAPLYEERSVLVGRRGHPLSN